MPSRLDNLSLADLRARQKENEAELEAILAAVEKLLRAACPIKDGKVYTILPKESGYRSYLTGRRLLVHGLTFNASYYDPGKEGMGYLTAYGPLKRLGKRPANIGAREGRYNYKSTTLDVARLDPATEGDD